MVLIPLAMLVTGTRTNLIIFVALIATIGSAKNLAVPIHRMLVNIAVLVGAGVVLFPVAASFAISDNAFLASRVQAFLNVVQGRALDDQSFFGRYEQYDTAMQLIGAHPVFGLTLGTQLDYSLDTPLLTVVHLGVLGTALLLLFVIAIIIAVVRVSRAGHPTAAYTAFKGLMLVALCNVPFGTPFEDRGFGLAVLLALTTMASEIAHPDLAARAFTRDVRRRPNMYAGSAEGLPGVAG
jgi:O-antigen ligase